MLRGGGAGGGTTQDMLVKPTMSAKRIVTCTDAPAAAPADHSKQASRCRDAGRGARGERRGPKRGKGGDLVVGLGGHRLAVLEPLRHVLREHLPRALARRSRHSGWSNGWAGRRRQAWRRACCSTSARALFSGRVFRFAGRCLSWPTAAGRRLPAGCRLAPASGAVLFFSPRSPPSRWWCRRSGASRAGLCTGGGPGRGGRWSGWPRPRPWSRRPAAESAPPHAPPAAQHRPTTTGWDFGGRNPGSKARCGLWTDIPTPSCPHLCPAARAHAAAPRACGILFLGVGGPPHRGWRAS